MYGASDGVRTSKRTPVPPQVKVLLVRYDLAWVDPGLHIDNGKWLTQCICMHTWSVPSIYKLY